MFSVSEWGMETKYLCAGIRSLVFCMCTPVNGGFAGVRKTFCFFPPMGEVWQEVGLKVTGILRRVDPRRS